ncbi:hypothetical protein TNCV_4229911 [Trichonephila clavipes]|nr:hypothetical protein TNCV_4229911 [Trichonephila clavipes]
MIMCSHYHMFVMSSPYTPINHSEASMQVIENYYSEPPHWLLLPEATPTTTRALVQSFYLVGSKVSSYQYKLLPANFHPVK